MSIRSQIDRINSNIAAAYTACSEKGATMPVTENSDNLADTVASIQQGGGGAVEEKDVNFYDYDGSLLYSFTKEEFLSLNEMPSLPTHSGLIAQTWNKTLSDMKTYTEKYGVCDAGALYQTTNGATRLYFLIPDNSVSLNFTLYVSMGAGTFTVESNGEVLATETVEYGYSQKTISCVLPIPNSYPASYCVELKYSGISLYSLNHYRRTDSFISGDIINHLVKVELGNFMEAINSCCFKQCTNLKTITMPQSSVSSFYESAFQECLNLIGFVFPQNVNIIGIRIFYYCKSLTKVILSNSSLSQSMFEYCYSLQNLVIPSNARLIPNYCFSQDMNLRKLLIPKSINNIEAASFSSNRLLREIDLSAITDPTELPTLGATVFANVFDIFVIYVYDQACLNALSSMTNWSYYADKIRIKG